tara:strand:+ start:1122 stop:1709 length:588 start_codon:yes stop_codon:yes gene_type:complete
MKKYFKKILGKKIDLIDLNLSYLNDFHSYSLEKKLYNHLVNLKPPKNKNESKKYLKSLILRSSKNNANWWFIYLKDEEKVIGTFGVKNMNFKRKSFEIVFAISPNYWGKGIFSEILYLIIDRFIIKNNFQRIFVITYSDNLNAIYSLKNNFFVEESELKDVFINRASKSTNVSILSFCKDYDLKKYLNKIKKRFI